MASKAKKQKTNYSARYVRALKQRLEDMRVQEVQNRKIIKEYETALENHSNSYSKDLQADIEAISAKYEAKSTAREKSFRDQFDSIMAKIGREDYREVAKSLTELAKGGSTVRSGGEIQLDTKRFVAGYPTFNVGHNIIIHARVDRIVSMGSDPGLTRIDFEVQRVNVPTYLLEGWTESKGCDGGPEPAIKEYEQSRMSAVLAKL